MARCRAGQGLVHPRPFPSLSPPFPSFPPPPPNLQHASPSRGQPCLDHPVPGDCNTPQQDTSASSLAALPFPRVKLHRTSLPDQVRKLLGHPREPGPWRSTWLMPHDTLPSSARLTPPDLRRKGFDALKLVLSEPEQVGFPSC